MTVTIKIVTTVWFISCESNRKPQTTCFYEDGEGDKNAIMKKALDILIPSKNKSSEMLFVYS